MKKKFEFTPISLTDDGRRLARPKHGPTSLLVAITTELAALI